MKYTEPPLTIAEQLSLLQCNNLTIQDEHLARNVLESVGYFRLKNYMAYFKHEHRFRSGTLLEDIHRLYEFDKALRITLFDAIADIEVAVKALVNNSLA